MYTTTLLYGKLASCRSAGLAYKHKQQDTVILVHRKIKIKINIVRRRVTGSRALESFLLPDQVAQPLPQYDSGAAWHLIKLLERVVRL